MDEQFWHKRWEQNDIGFHKDEPHHYLLRFIDRLEADSGDIFLVPLCGKSPDLVWLNCYGLDVVGVELSRLAVDAFVEENRLPGGWTTAAGMSCWLGERYKLFCGDFFLTGFIGAFGQLFLFLIDEFLDRIDPFSRFLLDYLDSFFGFFGYSFIAFLRLFPGFDRRILDFFSCFSSACWCEQNTQDKSSGCPDKK